MALFFIAQITGSAVTLLVFVALTRLLGPAGFGIYNLTVSSGMVVFALLFGWMGAAVTRFHFAAEFKDRAISVVLGTGLILLIIGMPILTFAWFKLPKAVALPVVLVAVYCLCHALHDIMMNCLRVYRAGKPFAIAIISRPLLGLICALGLVGLGLGPTGAVLGMSAGALIMGGYALTRVYSRAGMRRPDLKAVRKFLYFGAPMSIAASATSVVALLTQTSLAILEDLESVGIFAAALVLTMRTIAMPMMILSRVASPSVYEAYEAKGAAAAQAELDRHFSFLMMLAGPVALVLFAANQTVAQILFEDSFGERVARNLPFLALSAFVVGVQASFYSFCFTISQRTWVQFAITGGMTVLHALIVFEAVALLGHIGAAMGTVVTALIGIAIFSRIGRRIYPIQLPVKDLAKFAASLACGAPLVFYADYASGVLMSLSMVVAGLVVFALGLLVLQQTAMSIIACRLRAALLGPRTAEA